MEPRPATHLKDKVTIVTGAGRGIGLEICRELAGAGARVVLNDMGAELARQAAAAMGSHCLAVPGDASDPEVIRELVDTAVSRFGKLDIAIANAGITLFGEFLSYTREDFFRVMEVNLAGTFLSMKYEIAQMLEQGTPAAIVNIGSVVGDRPMPGSKLV